MKKVSLSLLLKILASDSLGNSFLNFLFLGLRFWSPQIDLWLIIASLVNKKIKLSLIVIQIISLFFFFHFALLLQNHSLYCLFKTCLHWLYEPLKGMDQIVMLMNVFEKAFFSLSCNVALFWFSSCVTGYNFLVSLQAIFFLLDPQAKESIWIESHVLFVHSIGGFFSTHGFNTICYWGV